ncbi:MAG: hypothetical protein NTX97_13335 [Bacteroidetes bacterium]|nr:hypothetical protein [Bacteroidota bacterium]
MRPKYQAQPVPGGSPKKIEINILAHHNDDDDESEIPQMHWRPKTAEQIEREKKENDFKINRIWF